MTSGFETAFYFCDSIASVISFDSGVSKAGQCMGSNGVDPSSVFRIGVDGNNTIGSHDLSDHSWGGEGIAICAELIEDYSTIPGVAGVHIMAPGNDAAIPEVIAAVRAKLTNAAI